MKAKIILFILPFFILFFIKCKKSNQNPVISSIHGPNNMYVEEEANFTCNAYDPDGDELIYSWSCTQGILSSSMGKTVSYKAPGASGTVNITVTVRDGKGGSDFQSKTITIHKLTQTIINWQGAVPAGYAYYWTYYIKANWTIHGNFSVDVHDINFLILDENNFDNWWNGRSYNYVVKISRSTGSSFSALIPHDGTYYIILDNTYSLITDKFVRLLVQITSP
ncbi:MAG: Ig-like domain-containing protein [candidate division WOR-3 bacterium]|nr:Ig-like domain-containing protein [candidate division WOR-3 bacterium]